VKVIVYGDFNSLYCYLASQRADRLVREGKADVEWSAVEHRPRLPVTGAKPPPGSVGAQDDLAEAAQLAPPASSCPPGPRP
jgi:2-hydroxychromene-2-carboxylate isomerase